VPPREVGADLSGHSERSKYVQISRIPEAAPGRRNVDPSDAINSKTPLDKLVGAITPSDLHYERKLRISLALLMLTVSPVASNQLGEALAQCICHGCGCKGGPGWRNNSTGQCVSHKQLKQVCPGSLADCLGGTQFANAFTAHPELAAKAHRRPTPLAGGAYPFPR
jgi:hypothetical protein